MRHSRILRPVGLALLLVAAAWAPGRGVSAQGVVAGSDTTRPAGGLSGLAVRSLTPIEVAPAERQRRMAAGVDSLVRHALTLPPDRRRPVAEEADSLAAVLLAFRPEAADAHHWRAVTAGLLAEVSGTGDKVRLGRLAYARASAAVEIDDSHAGGHHVLGRVHLGVLRLSWIARFFAGRMGLGPLLDAASWEVAEHHLRRAAELAPGEPSFHFELGALLAERGRPDEARPHLERVLELPAPHPLEREFRKRATRLLERLGDDESPAP